MPNPSDVLLPGLPHDLILQKYRDAPGNEIGSGKFCNPESSACLAANAFGFFFPNAIEMPPLPGLGVHGSVARITPEAIVRFPWRGGLHPCLDLLVETEAALIGVESKRYEPFRSKSKATVSDTFRKLDWGSRMNRYKELLLAVRDGAIRFKMLDVVQLAKHALGLRTEAFERRTPNKRPVLHYLYVEPVYGPRGREVKVDEIELHRSEIERFASLVEGDEVQFNSCTYGKLLSNWIVARDPRLQTHAKAMLSRFDITRP
jgi:hypothetical protein